MNERSHNPWLSIVIPTYRREQVLLDTLAALLRTNPKASEIVLVDQTPGHEAEVTEQLENWCQGGAIRWIRQSAPSIPAAMNRGAIEARGEILLYLDDDIIPDSGLIGAHLAAHREHDAVVVAGRVLQPWHGEKHRSEPFTQSQGEYREEFMGGNFSIRRERLLASGGFDENFRGAAYRFEREFADRILDAGGKIWYEPAALIHHLHHASGGTRSRGDHLTSWNPRHPVGAYYYLLRSARVRRRAWQAFARLFASVATRHHLRKPWYLPVTLFSEIAGLFWAVWLARIGPRLPLRPGMESSAS